MELQWIDDFLALCQTRNFTRAAEARCTTQPAYSRRVQKLEEWLGAPLFYRESRPVSLTPAGEAFLSRAHRLREEIFDARRAVLTASSHFRKSLRIYTTNTLASAFLCPWLGMQDLKSYSLIVASIAGCLEAVRRGHADICLIPHFGGAEEIAGLKTEEAGEDRLVLMQSPSAANKVRLENGKLCGPVMVYTPGTAYGARVAAMLEAYGVEISEAPVCESASAEALLAQAKAGLGAAFVPAMLAGPNLERCAVPEFFDLPYKIVALRR
ncbi:LysR family transcriptional regulator [Methylocystis heyeri]|uniref:LysR family transcriptional regulator n=1 Tax=Methylocystis heyeri TaxID=391905 RepID=A0A6B8KJW7_9HYPH|nr:LysR family transcriptional regulator [Methylocystis heyeri]QGM48002.1 LysR family transcriptional regulator [Methylocystis heyeri]